MKFELKVLYEEEPNRQPHMIIKYGDDTLAAITLPPHPGAWDVTARERRDALAGVFLAALTAAGRAAVR